MEAALDLSAQRIAAARQSIAANAVLTPVIDADWLGSRVGATVKFKAECLQRTGSFKVRGVSVRLGGARERFGPGGVVAASAGNHARALAYVAARAGIACQIFMPSTASVSKIRAVQAAGASLALRDESVDGCLEHAREYADANDATFVHPFDDADIVLGQATLGAELLEQIPEMRTVVLPIGGGGLASGVAAILKQADPTIRVVGVQSELCAPVADPERPVDDLRFALADGIAVKRPGALTAPLLERYVDELCTVDEDAIAEAIVALMQHGKLVVEGAGAVSVAALLSGVIELDEREVVIAVLSGGNIDLDRLSAASRLHESSQGTTIHFATKVPDHPGGLAALLVAIAEGQGNVLSIEHLRDAGERGFHETRIEILLQTRGIEHREELLRSLAENGYEIVPLAPERGFGADVGLRDSSENQA